MLDRMVAIVLSLLLVSSQSQPPQAPPQEKPVDENSARVTLPGCINGRSFIVVEGSEDRPVSGVNIAPGRVFRLAGRRSVIQDIRRREGTAVEITGVVRKNDISGTTQGTPIDSAGRIRIGGGPMTQDPTRVTGRDPLGGVPVLDVESFRPINAECPTK